MPALSGGTMLYSRRSAKSVACSRLKVVGVREFFFFPIFVAAFTRAEEFHSVTNTRRPAAVSHLASSASCVVFPDPSMPSTTNSFPGYSCGVLRLFSIRSSAGAQTDGFPQRSRERRYLTTGGPELELGVAGRPELYEVFVAPVVQFDARDRLRVTAVERFGQPENRGKRTHRRPFFRAERAEVAVRLLRRGFAVITGDEGNRFGLCRLETAQIAVLDEVVRVLV